MKSTSYTPRARFDVDAWKDYRATYEAFKGARNIDKVLTANNMELENDLYDVVVNLVAECAGATEPKDGSKEEKARTPKEPSSRTRMHLHYVLSTRKVILIVPRVLELTVLSRIWSACPARGP